MLKKKILNIPNIITIVIQSEVVILVVFVGNYVEQGTIRFNSVRLPEIRHNAVFRIVEVRLCSTCRAKVECISLFAHASAVLQA